MKRGGVVLVLVVLFLSGCATEERPEGVVERWLTSINQGSAGKPDRYARPELAGMILPGWDHCDPGALDVIEVGAGKFGAVASRATGILVPYRIEFAADVDTRCDIAAPQDPERDGVAMLNEVEGGWLIVAVAPPSPYLVVPSEGGPEVAGASVSAWALGLGIGIVVCLAVMLLMATVGKHETLVEEVAGEDVGHQHGGPA
jgi:hypothetical protein